MLDKREKIENAIKAAEGNMKHEDMYLDNFEKDLIRRRLEKKISHDEFIKETINYYSRGEK